MGKKAQQRRRMKVADKLAAQKSASTPRPGGVTTVTDASFDRVVLGSDVPVLVDFWAPWCGPCKAVAPVVKELAKEHEGRLRVAKLNTEDNRRVPGRYGIRSIPTLMLFKRGELAATKVGAAQKETLSRWIQSHI